MSYQIEPYLKPFLQFETQNWLADDRGIPMIGGNHSTGPFPNITHAEFISQYVPVLIPEVVQKYGRKAVLRDLAELALPVYGEVSVDAMARFWSQSVEGLRNDGGKPVPEGERNKDLAFQFGIRPFYGPILELAQVHGETKVFCDGKYFGNHCVRMGRVLTRFGLEAFQVYIELAKQLLRHNVYDWSAEQLPEHWDALAPAIEKYGFQETYGPMIDAECALGQVRGSKDSKYQTAYLRYTITDLYPYLIPRLMQDGPMIVRQDLDQIVAIVQEFHQRGAFQIGYWFEGEGYDFFNSFKKGLPLIREKGIAGFLESKRAYWERRLITSKK